MKCRCKKSCIETREKIPGNISQRYKKCPLCSDKILRKAIPLKKQVKPEKIDENYQRCEKCGRRHIDIVMAHILKILIKEDLIDENASIRKAGTPLITPAAVLDEPPYLPEKSLVIMIKNIDKKTALKLYENIPELKAVIKADTKKTAGQLTRDEPVNRYELLAGCGIRCDIQQTPEGELVIYKDQSLIHIEYPKEKSQKIEDLDRILSEYENPTVLDAMCGPGTLGIYALLKNAEKVHFNDIYKPAAEATEVNLKINRIPEDRYEVTCKDIFKLKDEIKTGFDIAIIDLFPEVNPEQYRKLLEKTARKIIII